MSSPHGGTGRPGVAAFLSASGGTGRTSAVANLAWVLSSAGKRVLVIDWGSDVPRVREYLEPFLVERRRFPPDLGRALLAVHAADPLRADGPPPEIERFALPGSAGYLDVVAPMGADRSYPITEQADPGAIADLRAKLVESDYDQILIDAPTGGDDAALTLVAILCEVAVICFRPRPRAIADGADLAATLRKKAPIRIDLVPVATLFDDADELSRARRIRSAIHNAFAELLTGQAKRIPDGGPIEIPYRPYDAFDPLLAILVEEPASGTLEAQYERLASAVTGGAVTALNPVSSALRARYRRAFGMNSSVEPDRILIAYAPSDRVWADWVREQLDRAGALTGSLRTESAWLDADDPPGVVVITSKDLDIGRVEEELDGRSTKVLRLRLTEEEAPSDHPSISVDEPSGSLRSRMLSFFGLIDRPGTAHDPSMRLPGSMPPICGLRPRHPLFVGRDAELEGLRDRLTAAGEDRVVATLSGVPGVGKSELALEYAYRFACDYDLVWWLPSQDRQSVLISLAQLASRLGESGSTSFGTTSALDQVATDPAFGRFLLIYDNADDPVVLDELLPEGSTGHVLITSGTAPAQAIELVPMSEDDSARLLGERVPGLSPDDARLVATAVAHLPLALDLAGSWLEEIAKAEGGSGASVADAATWATRALLDQLDGHPTSSNGIVARMVDVVVESLGHSGIGRVAVLLAQYCSFLSGQGVDLGLVRSSAMLAQLVDAGGAPAEPLRLDAGEIDRALWIGDRYGLFRVDWGDQYSLRLHRVVQTALRAGMSDRERADRRAQVLAGLAAYAPREVELTAHDRASRFAELQKHVFPSESLASDDPQVRRWLVNQVRFLYTDGGAGVRRAAVEPGRQLLDAWTEKYGPADPLRCRLAAQLANIHRVLGEPKEALRLDDMALGQQRRSLDFTHPQTLISARGRGGDLRGLGLFAEALVEDESTWEGFRGALGEDHPHTRSAANNLAASRFLSGDVLEALVVEEDNYRRRQRLFGENDPDTWWSLARIGVYQRELGHYDDALKSLLLASQKLQSLYPELSHTQLGMKWNYAIALRRKGRFRAAKDANVKNLRDFQEIVGPHHPDTLACTLSFAADHRTVVGDPTLAVDLATTALNGFLDQVRLPEHHPFVALCRLGLGLSLRAAGEDAGAIAEVGTALATLRARLGEPHPWTLAAAVDEARVATDRESARRLIEVAHADCLEFLGGDHPYTAIAAHNLGLAAQSTDLGWREIDVDIPQT